jgi:6-phosphogluconolactonase
MSGRYGGRVDVRQYQDSEELSRATAAIIFEDCQRALANGDERYTFGVSGGRTPVSMFDALAAIPIPWSRVHIVQVDERVAPRGSEDRNFTQLGAHLLDRVEIPPENVHPMPVEDYNLASACRRYEDELQRVTGGSPLNLLQLGLGDDGHTASLAPGDPILEVNDRAVWYVEQFNGLPRMSMTYPLINRAERLIWLVAGSAKAEMCRRLVAAEHAIPAGRVSQENAILLVDSAAANEL